MTQLEKLRNDLESIREVLDTDVVDVDIVNVQNKGLKLTQLIGLSSECKAKAKKLVENAKLFALSKIQDEKIGTNIMLNKMNSMCADELEVYEYADRINAALVHGLDFLRSCIALYRTELENSLKTSKNTNNG